MKLNQIADKEGARKKRMRVGLGVGSGKGKTAGRGVKGGAVRLTLNFEGVDKNIATGGTGDRRISTVATSTIMLRNRTP